MTQFTLVAPAQPLPAGSARKRGSAHRSANLPGSRSAMLERLARELDLPVEAFLTEADPDTDSPGAAPVAEAGDLLALELVALVRHWLAIGDGQARRRVLSLARQEAERSGLRVCA
ncbi:hypothetical protein MKK75_29515 [Methylobacterium sp. J-030]|uniref:hypothetical protein n=1 Tax=Methylobacterium sp. J-030 TaxID=2836627 RepID=UPI001FB924C9|nr:hypothetical protein [Methylobacterium sp. J-030]MCJ2072884.1 hypothetical protein [Methylobacterium sp. J-030]